MKKLILTVIASAAIIAGIFMVANYVSSKSISIPEAYYTARISATTAAARVSTLVSDSLANLSQIETLDRTNKPKDALMLVEYELGRRQQKQAATTEISTSLERMAYAAGQITPAETAGRLAIETISTGVTMVSRVVTYNTYLDQLFTALQHKFRTGQTAPGTTVRDLITNMNEEARAINLLGERFSKLEQEFDEAYIK